MAEYITALHDAAYQGKIDVLLSLLGQGINVNSTEEQHGWTALNWAAAYGKTETLKSLISYGADVNIADHYGLSPLHWASLNGHNDVALILMDYRANINALANDGSTPLHSAVMANQRVMVWNLLIKGADCSAYDQFGRSPLDIAEEKCFKDIAHMLKNAEKKSVTVCVERALAPLLYHVVELSSKLETLGDGDGRLKEQVNQLAGSNVRINEYLDRQENEKTELRRTITNFNKTLSDLRKTIEEHSIKFKMDIHDLTKDVRRLERRFYDRDFPQVDPGYQNTWSDSGHYDSYEKPSCPQADFDDLQQNDLDQDRLKDTIVIIGIEETLDEDLISILKSLAKVLGVEMEEGDVVKTQRTPDVSWENFKPRIIEVQFKDGEIAQNWIAAFKAKKTSGIVATSVDPSLAPHQIFVNQKLTVYNRQLLNRTKEFALVNNFKFAWAQNGAILLRKDNRGPTIRIRSLKDFPMEHNFQACYTF